METAKTLRSFIGVREMFSLLIVLTEQFSRLRFEEIRGKHDLVKSYQGVKSIMRSKLRRYMQ